MSDPSDDEWDADEFGTLLSNAQCSNAYLAALLPNRSEGAVMMVRQGICDYHKGRENFFLSPLMLEELRMKRGLRACFVCQELF